MADIFVVEDKSPSVAAGTADPREALLQFTTAYIPCAALWVAAELQIADLIGTGSTPVAELAAKTSTNEDALFRVLRLLAMVGIFAETGPRCFFLTPPAELLRSDVMAQQAANSAGSDTRIPPPEEESVSVLRAMSNKSDRTDELRSMPPSLRAREAAASGFASGTSGDHKSADHYFDIAFSSLDEVWSSRASLKTSAPAVVEEVSEAAAQVDPVDALQRSQRLLDPSAEAISMLAVARVVVGQP